MDLKTEIDHNFEMFKLSLLDDVLALQVAAVINPAFDDSTTLHYFFSI